MKLIYCEQRLSSFGTASEAGPSGVERGRGPPPVSHGELRREGKNFRKKPQ